MTNTTDKAGKKKYRTLRVILTMIVALIAVASVAFAIYVNDYYRADDRANAALQLTKDVRVRTLSNGGYRV